MSGVSRQESVPLRRLGSPEEVVQTVMFLLSEARLREESLRKSHMDRRPPTSQALTSTSLVGMSWVELGADVSEHLGVSLRPFAEPEQAKGRYKPTDLLF